MIRRHPQWVLYLLTLLCQLFLLWQGREAGLFPPPSPGTDQQALLEASRALAGGGLPPETYRYSYGYTVFLTVLTALGGGKLVAMRILHAMTAALIPVVIYRAGRLAFHDRSAAFAGALAYLFYAPALLISLDFLRAAPLALAFVAFYDALLRGVLKRSVKWLAFAGVLAALTVLGRENFAAVIFVPLLFLFVPRIRRRLPRRGVAVFIIAALLPVLAVMTLNYVRFGSFQPVPGNAANIMQFYHGEAAVRDMGAAAVSMLGRIPGQFSAFFSNYELANSLSVYAHRELIGFLNVFWLPYQILMLFAFAGAWHFRRNRAVQLAMLLVLAYAGSILFFVMFYRFRIPAAPLVALLAGGGAAALAKWIKARDYRTLAAFAATGIVFLILTSANPDALRPFSDRAAVARLLIERGEFDRAGRYLQKMTTDGHDVRAGFILLEQRRVQP